MATPSSFAPSGAETGSMTLQLFIPQQCSPELVTCPTILPTAQTKATGYATQNGLKNREIVSNTVAPDDMSITMTTSRTVPYYFLQLVGLSSGTVKPIAKAGIQQDTEGARGLIPVGLPCTTTSCSYTVGTEYQLVEAGGNGA